MNITEKSAYLKGLTSGLEIDDSTKEGKLLLVLVETVELMADEIADLQEVYDELDEAVEVLDEDLHSLESELFGHHDPDHAGCCHGEHDEDWGELYEVTCGSCGHQLYIDEDMLDDGSMDCPNCGELLEFDFALLPEEPAEEDETE